tara:strand:+ start:266 stop:529 length:264 start_codon:yes stop_codon:yes gene_type:complete
MGFKKKNYLKVGDIKLPRPPHHATHIKIHCADKKYATVQIKDVDTLIGVEGKIQYLRFNMKTKKLVETFKDKYNWDGKEVVNYKFDI